jgi:hypothetical protein
MQGTKLSKICENVMQFFNRVTEVDKKIKFVKRQSKVGAKLFTEVLVAGCLSDPRISLERLCKLMKARGVTITKQGLHQRFNAEATALMRDLFLKALEQFKTENNIVMDLLKPFSSVHMIDSSGISLPGHLKDLYKGCGGSASEAGMKLQVLFDYFRGQITQLTITEGTKSDQGFDNHLSQIQENSLHLQDLGYFKLKSFAAIEAKNAYFVSRYLYPTTIFNEAGEKLDLLKELQKSGLLFSEKLKLGEKEKIDVRLVAYRLSDEEAEKRIRKLHRNAQKKGKTLKKETLELARWSIYVTNVPEEILTAQQIYLVYSLRWQIELFFKLCKSEAGIAQVSGKKTDRILCEIYAKLMCVVMLLYFCFPLRWQNNQELSFYKAYKALKLEALSFFKALTSKYRLLKFMIQFFNDLKDFAFKDKYRKKRRLCYQELMDSVGQEVLV